MQSGATRLSIIRLFFLFFSQSLPPTHGISLSKTQTLKGLTSDRYGRPRLSGVFRTATGIFARLGCCAVRVDDLSVKIAAESNRQLLFSNFGISLKIRNSRGPLLTLSEIDMHVSNVSLGWIPLVFVSTGVLAMTRQHATIAFLARALCWLFILRKAGDRSSTVKNVIDRISTYGGFLKNQKSKRENCSIEYNYLVSNEDISKSPLIRFALGSVVLRSLMDNSVLKAAATTADDFAAINNDSATSSALILSAQQQQTFSSPIPTISPPRELTRLLSATAFQLIKCNCSGDGKLYLQCQAVFPPKNDNARSRLDFTLRCKPFATSDKSSLAFGSPECRFSVSDAFGGGALVKKILPDIWVPVGYGIGVPPPVPLMVLGLGGSHIHRIESVNINDYACNIRGRVSFKNDEFVKNSEENGQKSWIAPIGESKKNGGIAQISPSK